MIAHFGMDRTHFHGECIFNWIMFWYYSNFRYLYDVEEDDAIKYIKDVKYNCIKILPMNLMYVNWY